ncbi:MAG: MFS transporter [Anaerolineae bacterium]|nr:MFS transporter [Anaerolineae bacterium]
MNTQTMERPNHKVIFFIIFTTFLNMVGLTLIIPLAPFLVARYVGDSNNIGLTVGWLTSAYAICQFIAAPGLGAFSDRFGRRPIMLLCLLGSAGGYLLLGIGGSLWVLFLGRIIDGLTGANGAILNAYIADIVPPTERGKYFGWLGAVGAISVILGPTVGGFMAKLGYQLPFFAASGVLFINLLLGFFFMPESLPKEKRTASINLVRLNPISTVKDILTMPQLRWLLVAIFLTTLSFIAISANISLFAKDSLNWDTTTVGTLFSVFGVSSLVAQAVVLPWLIKHLGTLKVTIVGLIFAIISFLLMSLVAVVASPLLMYIAFILLAIGEGLISPSLLDLITRATDARSQGKVLGGNQSLQSLANMAGPLYVGGVYDNVGHAAPYLSGAGMLLLSLGALILALPALKRSEADKATDSVITAPVVALQNDV